MLGEHLLVLLHSPMASLEARGTPSVAGMTCGDGMTRVAWSTPLGTRCVAREWPDATAGSGACPILLRWTPDARPSRAPWSGVGEDDGVADPVELVDGAHRGGGGLSYIGCLPRVQ
jgi:hypothetical protein